MPLIIILFISLLIPAPNIVVQLQAENGAAIVGVTVEYRQENGELSGSCVSDGDGRCQITLSGELKEGDIIRGVLDLGPSGVRSLIWQVPEQPEVTLVLDEFGHVIIPGHHVHPTPEAFSDVWPTPLPIETVQPIEEAAPLATTEFVVIDLEAEVDAEPVYSTIEAEEVAPTIAIFEPEEAPTSAADGAPEGERPWPTILLLIAIFLTLWIGTIIYMRRQNHA